MLEDGTNVNVKVKVKGVCGTTSQKRKTIFVTLSLYALPWEYCTKTDNLL